MDLFCPHIKFDRNVLVCIYKCKTVCKCEVYERNYDKIKELEIEDKYIQKYGVPTIPVPDGLIRKEKLRLKKEKQQAKADLIKARLAKKQAKVDAKEAKLSARAEKKYQKELKKKEKEQKKQDRFKKLVEKWTPVVEGTGSKEPAVLMESKETPLKRKRRTKAEMEAARLIEKVRDIAKPYNIETIPSVEKKKRVRRTKAEIEADNKVINSDFMFTLNKPETPNVITLKVLKHRKRMSDTVTVPNPLSAIFDDK